MKILLLGGTGAMGRHLTEILANAQNELFITTRSAKKSLKDHLFFIQGDAHDPVFLKNLLQKDWDVIVDFMVYTTDEFQARASELLAHTKQYVFLSSSRVYAQSQTPLTERSDRLLDIVQDREFLLTDEYALAKAREENILFQSGKKNWTIIRPYITFDEYRLQLGPLEKECWLYRALHGRTIVFSRDVAGKKTTLTYGFDVACGIASVLGKPGALGEVFHITQSRVYTWYEILEIYLDALEKELGKRPKVKMTGKSPRLDGLARYQVLYDRLYDRTFDDTKIAQYIDVSNFADPAEKLKCCIHSFLQKPHWESIVAYEEATCDRLTGERMKTGEFLSKKEAVKYFFYRYFWTFAKFAVKIRRFAKHSPRFYSKSKTKD